MTFFINRNILSKPARDTLIYDVPYLAFYLLHDTRFLHEKLQSSHVVTRSWRALLHLRITSEFEIIVDEVEVLCSFIKYRSHSGVKYLKREILVIYPSAIDKLNI